jgi:hypothetical protein
MDIPRQTRMNMAGGNNGGGVQRLHQPTHSRLTSKQFLFPATPVLDSLDCWRHTHPHPRTRMEMLGIPTHYGRTLLHGSRWSNANNLGEDSPDLMVNNLWTTPIEDEARPTRWSAPTHRHRMMMDNPSSPHPPLDGGERGLQSIQMCLDSSVVDNGGCLLATLDNNGGLTAKRLDKSVCFIKCLLGDSKCGHNSRNVVRCEASD